MITNNENIGSDSVLGGVVEVKPETHRLVPDDWEPSIDRQVQVYAENRVIYPGYPQPDKLVKMTAEEYQAWVDAGRPLSDFPVCEPVLFEDPSFQQKLRNWAAKSTQEQWSTYLHDPRTWGMTLDQIHAWQAMGSPDEFENLSERFDYPIHPNLLNGLNKKVADPEKYATVYSGHGMSHQEIIDNLHPYLDKLLQVGVPFAFHRISDDSYQPYLGFYWNMINEETHPELMNAADPVVFREKDGYLEVILINSAALKEQDRSLGLPGGMWEGSALSQTALRELHEEAQVPLDVIDQMADQAQEVYRGPVFDPRSTGMFNPSSAAFMMQIPEDYADSIELKGGDDAAHAEFYRVSDTLLSSFFNPSHYEMILAAVQKWQEKTGRIIDVTGKIH